MAPFQQELIVQELVEQVILPTSVTAGILRCIHQGIVLCAAMAIKSQVLVGIFTSDVRTSDGWQIFVDVGSDSIQVSHVRREQSIAQVRR